MLHSDYVNILTFLQVTWDDKSLFINGERIMLFSGEVHPFRYIRLAYYRGSMLIETDYQYLRFGSIFSRRSGLLVSIVYLSILIGPSWRESLATTKQRASLLWNPSLMQPRKQAFI